MKKTSSKGHASSDLLREHQDENNVPKLYSTVCRGFLRFFRYMGTGRKTRDFTKLCPINCLLKMALHILQPHLLLCIASILTPLSGQSLWLEYLNGEPNQTAFRTFYENVNTALLHYQADVKSFPLEFRHHGVDVAAHMATCSLMVLLIRLHR